MKKNKIYIILVILAVISLLSFAVLCNPDEAVTDDKADEYEDKEVQVNETDVTTLKDIAEEEILEEAGEPEEEVKKIIPEKLNEIEIKYSLEFVQYLESLEKDYLETILYDDKALKEEYDLFEWRNIFYNDGIVFTADENIFPGSWYEPDINARAESLAEKEIERSRKIAVYALDKYPAKVLKENLGKLYILKSLNFYGVDYGGTNDEKYRVYIANNGIDMGYTALFIEKEFHHEFSSILFTKFEESEWGQINPAGFVYFDEQTGGSGAIREGRASQEFDTKMHEAGFLYEYAQSTLENDFNSFAENIFVNDGIFFKLVEEYEKLSLKLDLIVDFYSSIDPRFTLEYFKEISLLEK